MYRFVPTKKGLGKSGVLFKVDPIAAVIGHLSLISINLLAFYHQRRSLIGYATHYLFCDR